MGTTPAQDLTTQVEHVLIDLCREFDSLPAEVVEEHVHRQQEALAEARIRTYVPVLVRRGARDELRRLVRH